ncbi:hypothetical protein PJL18_03462 [Paenarthrobacter nicotinovorans]|nr:hypothetical protein [Paenarthrobacter nicotinovorans]
MCGATAVSVPVMSTTPSTAPESGSWKGTAVQLQGWTERLKCSAPEIWMLRSRASAVPGALVPTEASDQSAPATNIMPSARRCITGSPSTHKSRPTSSPTATRSPLSWLGWTSSFLITGMMVAKGCCRRYSSSSSRSIAKGASATSGLAWRLAERCQDSRTSRRSPTISSGTPMRRDSRRSWPARARFCSSSAASLPGTGGWTGFLIELPDILCVGPRAVGSTVRESLIRQMEFLYS